MKRMMILFLFPAFLWLGCEKEETDPCAEIVCLNDGFCANGLCNCPDGYGGSDCSIQQVPRSMVVKRITLEEWPATNLSGGAWDPISNTGPEITFQFAEGTEVLDNSLPYTEVSPGTELTYFPDLEIEDVEDKLITVNIYDWDGDNDYQIMSTRSFILYNDVQNKDFPTILSVEPSGGWSISFTIEVEYRF